VNDRKHPKLDASTQFGMLSDSYKDWTVENGLKSMSGPVFGNEMRKRVCLVHKRAGNTYQGLRLVKEGDMQAGSVKEGKSDSRSCEMALQATLYAFEDQLCEGGEGGFRKIPSTNQKNRQTENFRNPPSPPSPDEFDETAFEPTEEPCEDIFHDELYWNFAPSPDEVLAHGSALPEEAERESLEDLAWLFEPPADDAPVDGFTPMEEAVCGELPQADNAPVEEAVCEELPPDFLVEDDPAEPGGYEE